MNIRPLNLALLAGVIVAVAAAVYGIADRSGNRAETAACNGSIETARAMEGFNIGELAAFQIADEPIFVGDLSFQDENGEATGLGDHRGQFVLLNLWATWCVPCREEMPALAGLQDGMGSDDFQVLPVSVDLGDDSKPRGFYAEHDLGPLPFRHDGTMTVFNELKKRGLAFGMPSTVLVDRQGCAIGHLNGPAHWASDDAKALIGSVI